MRDNAGDNRSDPNTDGLERLLDDAGRAFRDRCIERPPDAPDAFIEAVRDARAGGRRAPISWRVKAIAGTIALAACLTLVITLTRQPLEPAPPPSETPHAGATPGGMNPLSAGALRMRILDRPLDDPDLPRASIVYWVTRTNPLGP